jgi:hypothetical protein
MQAVDLRELKRSVTPECNVEVGLKEYKSFLGFRNGHTKKFMYENLTKFKRKDCACLILQTFRQEIKPTLIWWSSEV